MAVAAPHAPSEGALSLDQAVGLLNLEPEREEAAPEPQEAPAEPQAEPEHPEPPQEGEGGEEPQEANPAEEPAEPEDPIEPPLFWDAEAKETFKALPRELQQKLSEQAEKISKDVSKSLQQAAEARKQAEQQASTLADKAGQVDKLVSYAEASFQADGWGDWAKLTPTDWMTLLRQDPDQYRPVKEQFDLRIAQLQQLSAAKQELDQQRKAQTFNAYLAAQHEELGRIAPDLATDTAKRTEIAKYLMDQGYAADRLKGVGAQDLVLARKAMLWDQAQKAKSSVKPQPKPAPAQAKPVKPAASNPTPPKQRATQELSSRLTRSGSIDDAVALLNARG